MKYTEKTYTWLVIFFYIIILAFLILTQAGSILVFSFPLLSLSVGLYLYFFKKDFYLVFSLWLTLIGPCLKRIIDYKSGYITLGLYEFTPLSVASISSLSFMKYIPKALMAKTDKPFTLCASTYIFSTLVSLINSSPINAFANSFVAFFGPFCLGFHVYYDTENHINNRRNVQTTLFLGTLVLSIYGISQFIFLPAWDKFALEEGPNMSQGIAEVMNFRIWSTMISQNDFGTVLAVGLLSVLSLKTSFITILCQVLGYIALLLTQARSAWLVLIVSSITFFSIQRAKKQLYLIAIFSFVLTLVISFVFLGPFSSVIIPRVESLFNLSSDVSFNARQANYQGLFLKSLSYPLGQGIAADPSDLITTEEAVDSDIMTLFYKLGWIGTPIFLTGTFMLITNLFLQSSNYSPVDEKSFEKFCFSGVVGIISAVGLQSTFYGNIGIFFWMLLGLGSLSRKNIP
jgi:hypothetical protein